MPRATARKMTPKTTLDGLPFVPPQLATLVDTAPTGSAWINETKYDGYRMQCHLTNSEAILYSRNALDWTHKFKAIAAEVSEALGSLQVVLDGEIVVNTSKGRASFHALQQALSDNATGSSQYMVFDLLYAQGVDLRQRPLTERRELLEEVMQNFKRTSNVRISKVVRGTAATALVNACKRFDEGIICKRKDARYVTGRSGTWVKVKCGRRQEFVVVGYSEPKGSRQGVGSLLLGVYDAGRHLRYSGRVGSGFDTDDLVTLRKALEDITVPRAQLSDEVDLKTVRESGKVHWVKPSLVAEVSFTEWTDEGLLRHPVFQGLREDKKATEVKREGA